MEWKVSVRSRDLPVLSISWQGGDCLEGVCGRNTGVFTLFTRSLRRFQDDSEDKGSSLNIQAHRDL